MSEAVARMRETSCVMQERIVSALEQIEGGQRFLCDDWQREDAGGGHGGGGRTRVLSDGTVFERAGVNFSEVSGTLPEAMGEKLVGKKEKLPFRALGTSLVFHPRSPMVPTVHANIRYLEVADKAWYGGGTDLTPYVLFDEDCVHFHTVLKDLCTQCDPAYYERFKKECDRYFYLPHRGESRGIGGIFFDYLGRDNAGELEKGRALVEGLADRFLETYVPIVLRRKELEASDAERSFQLLRRGRYVEFNLILDRGTQFGLSTGGRTESILMSLPPRVEWRYDQRYAKDSAEEHLLSVLREPRDWIPLS